MFNDFKGFDEKGNPVAISVPPTLLISSVAVVEDITKVVSLDAKNAGDLVYGLNSEEETAYGFQLAGADLAPQLVISFFLLCIVV